MYIATGFIRSITGLSTSPHSAMTLFRGPPESGSERSDSEMSQERMSSERDRRVKEMIERSGSGSGPYR